MGEAFNDKVVPIPDWVKSTVKDVSISINELRSRTGTYQYVLIADGVEGVELVAAPHAKDVYFYAAYFRVFRDSKVLPSRRMFFHGRIMDPKELPYEIEQGQRVFVFYDDWFIVTFDTMADAIVFLNDFITRIYAEDTTELTVIVGKGYGEGVLASINSNIVKLENDLWGPR